MSRRPAQLPLSFSRRGGARLGAGRPRHVGPGRRVEHLARQRFQRRTPAHVTLRVRPEVWNLRSQRCFRALCRAFRGGRERNGFRLVHFSVQGNHLHLLVEAPDEVALSRGMQGLAVRLARRLNKVMNGRRGAVFADRFHAHLLRSAAETANAIAYVLGNAWIHAARAGRPVRARALDPFASAALVAGEVRPTGDPPVVEPTTWLLTIGWRAARGPRGGEGTL